MQRESSNMGDISDTVSLKNTVSLNKKRKPAIVQKDISCVFSKLLNTDIERTQSSQIERIKANRN